MLAQAGRGVRRKMADAVRLIDSTGLRLAGVGSEWARFSTGVFGAKAHVVYDPDLGRPVYHAVTAANVNDITAAKEMPIEAGATYVFDLGYYDFAWWARLDALGCRLVTRFKRTTPLNGARDLPLAPQTRVLSDRIGFLPARQAMSRKNPMQDAVREIAVRTETGQILRLLSNDLDAPADELAELYKRRWQIELFFRLMKQTLRITKFVGRSENAVRIQIAVALIAYLLMCALQQITKDVPGFLELVQLVRANLMHRKDLTQLRKPPPPSPLELEPTPTLLEPNLNRTAGRRRMGRRAASVLTKAELCGNNSRYRNPSRTRPNRARRGRRCLTSWSELQPARETRSRGGFFYSNRSQPIEKSRFEKINASKLESFY